MPSDDYQDDPSTDHRKRDKSSSKRDKERRRTRHDDRDRSSKSDHRKSSERAERTEERKHRRSADTKTIPQHEPACTFVHVKSEPIIDSDVKVIPMSAKRGRRRW